tara:strand:- start:1195 stop:2121 length:927 start_codon:yes stop_codon:yes gene_type:complete
MKVVYGHTDSIYVKCDDIEKAKEVCNEVNNYVRTFFPNILGLEEHPVTLEFEKYYKSLGVGATKNRNAGLITWKDGEYLEEDEFVLTGFSAKRVAQTKLAKETQTKVLRMWVDGVEEEEISTYLHGLFNKVISGDIELSMLTNRTRYREERFKVKCMGECKKMKWGKVFSLSEIIENIKIHRNTFSSDNWKCCNNPNLRTIQDKKPVIGSGIEGVLYYNSFNEVPIDDSYLYMKIKNIKNTYIHPLTQKDTVPSWIAGKQENELLSFTPDYLHYAYQIVNKAEPIYKAMEWDVNNIIRSRHQDLEDWF